MHSPHLLHLIIRPSFFKKLFILANNFLTSVHKLFKNLLGFSKPDAQRNGSHTHRSDRNNPENIKAPDIPTPSSDPLPLDTLNDPYVTELQEIIESGSTFRNNNRPEDSSSFDYDNREARPIDPQR